MTASKKELEGLHALVCKVLTHELTKGREGDIPASLIAQAVNFLKNNGVEAVPTPNSPIQNLVDALPFTGDEGEDTYAH